MKRRVWRFFSLSLGFHLVLLAIFHFVPKLENQGHFDTRPIKVEITELPETWKLAPGSKGSGASKKPTFHFSPAYRLEPAHDSSDFTTSTKNRNSRIDDPASDWGSGSADFSRISDFSLFHFIYEQVDGSLSYPAVLARNNINGFVNTRIVINSVGSCDWNQTQVNGTNPYLRLYVLDLLKKVCRQNFKAHLGNRLVSVADLSFHFDQNENDDFDRVAQEKFIVGNVLSFYRNSHHSVMEWELGPFRGLFPIPTLYLNIPWIQDHWETLVKRKDPLNEFKSNFGEGQI